MASNKKTLIIYGPTGVGKTDFALEVGEKMTGGIINGDMGQCYKPLTIGTAKPDWQQESIPHYLFDIIDTPRDLTVTEYRTLTSKTIKQLLVDDRQPIIVGGSGFYISALLFPPIPLRHDKKPIKKNGASWQHLYQIDPERARAIHPHDAYRIERALALWQQTNQKPSQLKPSFDPIGPFMVLYLTRDRQELYERIERRVYTMMQTGWIDEVASLQGTAWEPFLMKKKLIGYDDIFMYLNKRITKQELITRVIKKTKNYAKRQMSFWRMLEKQLSPFTKDHTAYESAVVNLTTTESHAYINKLVTHLHSWDTKASL